MLTGKTAIITGGSDGIGLGIAKAFVKNNATICLVGRNPARLETAKEQLHALGGVVHTVPFDLERVHNLHDLVTNIETAIDHVDILINNAGTGIFLPFAETDESLLDTHINLNIKAPYMLTQFLLPHLSKSRGCVINISSYLAQRMLPGRTTSAYSMTKGAVNAWTKALAFELGIQGVKVNAIAPGSIQTSTFEANLDLLDDEGRRKFSDMVKEIYPLGYLGNPVAIGNAAVFLASENASWITGQIIAVDGGLTTN